MRIHVEFESRQGMEELKRRVNGTAEYVVVSETVNGSFEILVRVPSGTRREFEKILDRYFAGIKGTRVAIRRRSWLEDFWKRRSACAF